MIKISALFCFSLLLCIPLFFSKQTVFAAEKTTLESAYLITFSTEYKATDNLYIQCRQDDKYYTFYLEKTENGFSGTQSLPNGSYELISAGNANSTCQIKQSQSFEINNEAKSIVFDVETIKTSETTTTTVTTIDSDSTSVTENDAQTASTSQKIESVPNTALNLFSTIFYNSMGNVVILLILFAVYGIYRYKNRLR